MTDMWRVAAGRGGWAAAAFADGKYVSVGWHEAGDPTKVRSASEMLGLFTKAYPNKTERQVSVAANQMWRFLSTIQIGDDVISYDPDVRRYHLGRIVGAGVYVPDADEELQTRRKVDWRAMVDRDALSQPAKNSLNAILTLMLVPMAVAAEIRALAAGGKVSTSLPATEEEALVAEDLPDLFAGIEGQSVERIKDRIVKLDPYELQDLVAALLRAMGYRTSVASRGPDRGRDILATPDGFGFRPPRIIVEVKHRPGQSMGAPEVRAMPVGRQTDDRGLFVSTGGFTREAYYEAEHGKVPITLMTLDDLTRAIIDAYPQFDDAGRALLPLRRLFWPVG